MKVRKAIKKLIALGTGAILVGATVLGAMAAADLKDYPKPFAKDGKFDGLIVVGEAAAAMDVVGAVDIATSMQYAVKTTQTINVGTSAGSVMMTGDYAQVGGASDMLELGEELVAVQETLTENDLMLLKSGVLSTDAGTTDYNQYLKFVESAGEPSAVVYIQNDDTEELADFLRFENGETAFEYQLQFEEGLKSDIEDGELPDLEDESLVILGKTYSIVDTSVDDANDEVSLTLLGGDVTDTLYEGETKTYTVGGKDYEVEALIVSDTAETVKLKVNGEVTKQLADGDTERMSDGTEIGVREIMPNEGTEEGGGDLVEFYIGANKLVLADDEYSDDVYDNDLEVNDETIETAHLRIKATDVDGLSISEIDVQLEIDSTEGGDVYVGEGSGIREFLNEPEAMISPDWDIKYMGLSDTGSTTIKFMSDGDTGYKLAFETREGLSYNIPLVTLDNDDIDPDDLVFGDDNHQFWVAEDGDINKKDYFLLSTKNIEDVLGGGDNAYTHVLRFDNIGADVVSFTDLATGQLEATYAENGGALDGNLDDGSLVVGGTTFDFDVDATLDLINVDQDNNGNLDGAYAVPIVTQGGFIISLGAVQLIGGGDLDIDVYTLAKRFDAGQYADGDANGAEHAVITIADAGTDVDIDVTDVTEAPLLDLTSVEGQDLKRGMSAYGALYELTDDTTDADDLTIDYPLSQRGALVYVVAGETSSSKTSAAKGTVETVSLEKINVGAAKLDSEVSNVWGQNLILVGGPCANKAALEVMGVTADTCAEGFEEGKAMIKLYEKSGKVAMVVAGYSAMDTRRATRVIADYSKYKSDLMGMEVEVSGTTLTDISVMKAE